MAKNKKDIRRLIKQKRDELTKGEKENLDQIIFKKVINSREYIEAKRIFVFVSYQSEVDTHRIIKWVLKDGKELCVPKIMSKEEGMAIVKIETFEDLELGAYGILEPKYISTKVEEASIDLALLPGIAFDRHGGRVGYGGGYYDRFLKKARNDSKKIALAYSFQILKEVPMEEYDVFIGGIITD